VAASHANPPFGKVGYNS